MKWTIKQNENNQKWYFSIIAADNTAFPEYDDIVQQAVEKGIPQAELIGKKHFEQYFDKVRYGKTLPLPLEIELDPSFDARLIISPDKTRAELYIRKAKDTAVEIDKKMITNMLNNSAIKDIDYKQIQEDLAAFEQTGERETEILISEGILPKRGKNRSLVPHITKLNEQEGLLLRKKLIHAVEIAKEQAQNLYDKEFPLSQAQVLSFVEKDDLLFQFSEAEIGENGADIYGEPIMGLPGNDPIVLDLRNIVQSFEELKAGCSGILLLCQTGSGLKMRIIPYKDATVKAVIPENQMEVYLVLEAGRGAGSRLSPLRLKKALDEVNIPPEKYSPAILQQAIYAARQTFQPIEYTICKGSLPVAPNSYKFDWKVNFDNTQTASVKRGAVILEATFLEDGEAGIDVFGKTMGIDLAGEQRLPEHDNTILVKKTDKTVLFAAAVTGELSNEKNVLKIINSKTFNSTINKETGDIIFAGDLIINGNIEENRTVRAGGCLTVNGNAGVALIYTRESLLMNGGIKGEGRGTVWSKNDMALHFAETARLLAGENLHIEQYCFRCIVKTNGRLSLTGEPGSFIGGNAHAACGVHARNLGDYKTVRTIISFGQDYLVKDKIEVHEKEMQSNLLELAHIETELKDESISEDRIQELREQKVALLKCNTALGLKIFKLKEHFELHIKSEVRVTGTVYPGVILESHGRYFEIREPMYHVVFTFDPEKGRIICKPIEESIHHDVADIVSEFTATE
ncbi:MAG: FapA family protein [Treponema sp.]